MFIDYSKLDTLGPYFKLDNTAHVQSFGIQSLTMADLIEFLRQYQKWVADGAVVSGARSDKNRFSRDFGLCTNFHNWYYFEVLRRSNTANPPIMQCEVLPTGVMLDNVFCELGFNEDSPFNRDFDDYMENEGVHHTNPRRISFVGNMILWYNSHFTTEE